MRAFDVDGGFVVRLDLGEEVLSTLIRFVVDRGLKGAAITGIGAVRNTRIAWFDSHAKEYRHRDFAGDMELVNLTANLTWNGDDPFIHAHVTLSGEDFVAHSGHLVTSEIAVTGEFFIHDTGRQISRAPDSRTGLGLIDG